jgi:hypothetical protein
MAQLVRKKIRSTCNSTADGWSRQNDESTMMAARVVQNVYRDIL